jgi:PAS domain S-box-containing protein
MFFLSNTKDFVKLEVLENISTNIMVADADRNIVYMNKAVICFLQQAEAEIQKDLPHFRVEGLIGKNIDIFHKRPEHQRQMLDRLSGTHNGTIKIGSRLFDLIAKPLQDKSGKRLGTFVEWIDASLRIQNMDFAGQMAAVNKAQAVIQFNMDGTIVDANANFLSALGYSLDEIKGKHHGMFVEPSYRDGQQYRQFWDNLNRGEFQAAEYKRIGKGGKEVWIQASYNPIFGADGKPYKVVKFATDTTTLAIKRMEGERIGNLVDQNLEKIVRAVSDVNEAASTVHTVASSAEELSASVREISQSMSASKASVDTAMAQTNAADQATQQLAKNAESMNGIVTLIQTIAGQINLGPQRYYRIRAGGRGGQGLCRRRQRSQESGGAGWHCYRQHLKGNRGDADGFR